jgi:erythromycin esterase-like protein
LFASINAVQQYLDKNDLAAAQQARERYSCFNQYRHNAQLYGYATTFDISHSCQKKVIDQLKDLCAREHELLKKDGQQAQNEFFNAQQNAQVVKNAEYYYRSLFFSAPESSWNIRDTHMAETAQSILAYLKKFQKQPKLIVWAHNSHIGNAAATQMGKAGEINIGQLMKEKYGDKAVSIGFTTYSGTVSAASNWDGPVERKIVRPALENSYEDIFHQLDIPAFILLLNKDKALADAFLEEKLERAIGVIYKPETERMSHYFSAQLSAQFDAIIHCDVTKAVEPLEKTAEWISGEIPEMYPTGV